MKKNHVVVLIDLRGNLTSKNSDETVKRHIRYSRYLQELTEGTSKIIVASFHDISGVNQKYKELEFVQVSDNGFPSLKGFRNLKRLFNQYRTSQISIVAGDPWETYWVSLICKLFFSRSSKLQVQIHADVASEFWRKQSLANRVRGQLLHLNNRYINSIRFVSEGQCEKFKKRYGTGLAQHVIVPVPLNITNEIDELPKTWRSDILFMGRIHKDRGLKDFCNIVKNLNSASSEFKVNIVGTGPDAERFVGALENICGEERVKAHGFCTKTEIQEIVKSCRLLLSTAPSESYGRAMREAIFYGLPVWSVANEGALELQAEFGSQIVRILNLAEGTDSLFKEYMEFADVRISNELRKRLSFSDSAKIRTLVESWLWQ